MNSHRTLVRAAMVVDAEHVCASPGCVLVDNGRVIAAGSPQDIGVPAEARLLDLPESVIIPALVNAHAHLDLSHLGCRPYFGSFAQWIEGVRRERLTDATSVAQSVRSGVELSLAGGTALIGDIAGIGSTVPVEVLRDSVLRGTSFVEFFGSGQRQQAAIEAIRAVVDSCTHIAGNVRLGLQPHAPYSCGPEVFDFAATHGLPVCTHIAETLEEIEFAYSASGPLADMLRQFGVFDQSMQPLGGHPIDSLMDQLRFAPWLLAHANYIDDAHIEALANMNCSIVYCPRAGTYFGHPYDDQPPHRYQQMLDAGINVALGTDGLICLDTPDRICGLDEMRLLHRRDRTRPRTLLSMATVNGARALQSDENSFSFILGGGAGCIAVPGVKSSSSDPLADILRTDTAPRWLTPPWGDTSIPTLLDALTTTHQL